ncbi:MAG: hypothetical protein Q8P67_18165, partial [archaeon]|nr:hypothetical protein [archaeon]
LELLLLLLSAGVCEDREVPNVFREHLLNDYDIRALTPDLLRNLMCAVVLPSRDTPEHKRKGFLSMALFVALCSAESSSACVFRAALEKWTPTAGLSHETLFAWLIQALSASLASLVSRRPAPSLQADAERAGDPSSDGGVGGTGGEPLAPTEGFFGTEILFLYYLLYSCQSFRLFVVSRTDVELVVVPLLRYLYFARFFEQELPLILTTLIILVILTRDAPLNLMASQTRLPSVPWFSDRYLVDVSLLDLVFLISLKTSLRNLCTFRHVFLQQLCAGVLGNIAKYFSQIHPSVAHQFVAAFPLLFPKVSKHQLVAGLLDSLLYTLNLLLFFALSSSPSLIYNLLHQKDHFERFQHPSLANALLSIKHFTSLLDDPDSDSADDASAAVMAAIDRGLRSWKASSLTDKIKPVRFIYTEEEDGDEFFRPYVWRLLSATLSSTHLMLAIADSASPISLTNNLIEIRTP